MSQRIKLRDWAKDFGSNQGREFPPRLQLIVDGTRGENLNFFAKKAKFASSRIGEESKNKTSLELLSSPVDPAIRKLEFEMKLRALDSNSGLRGKIGHLSSSHTNVSQKKIQSVGSLLGIDRERPSAAKKEEPTIYFKSPIQHSRLGEDHSRLNESRSLLARMKDEFRSSTNNSFLGLHKNELGGAPPSTTTSKRSEPIFLKNVLMKQRQTQGLTTNESMSEFERRENVNHIKTEVYNKMLRPSRRECPPGGTLDNLFNILQHERSSGDPRDSASVATKSRERGHHEANRILVSENKSEVGRFSSTADFQKSGADVGQPNSFQKPTSSQSFPGDLISLLRKRLTIYPKDRIDSQQLDQLNSLSEEIIKIINSKC